MKSLKRILPFVHPYGWIAFWLVITVIFPVVMELLVPKALNYIIDAGIEMGDAGGAEVDSPERWINESMTYINKVLPELKK